jgi:hypothetical protein
MNSSPEVKQGKMTEKYPHIVFVLELLICLLTIALCSNPVYWKISGFRKDNSVKLAPHLNPDCDFTNEKAMI